MNCATPTDFNFSFLGFAKRGGDTDKHEHGWGLAIYEGRGLRTFHDSLPASVSRVAEFVATYPIKTLNMMAHIRYATQGDVSLENVHPFQREMWGINWAFAHNGEVPKYTNKRIGDYPLLGQTNKTDRFYHPVGDTDSEAVFCAVLNGLRAEFTELPTLPVLYETIQRFCHEIICGEEESTIFNFLLGCGQYTQFAYSWPGARPGSKVWNGLYYTIRRPPFSTARLADLDYAVNFENVTTQSDRVAVIATSPLTVNEEWNEFKRGQLLMFDKGQGYSELHDCQEVEQLGRGLCSEALPKSQKEGCHNTPALLRILVDQVIDKTKKRCIWAERGADLGCGCGGAGVAFRSCIEHLTGVDISPEMVDKARQRGCYDRLLVGDIECVVGNRKEVEDSLFDIVFACNVFSFIHDIRGVFQSVSHSMKRKDGIFAFSAEFIEGGDEVPNIVLQSCARYAHKRIFIEAIASEFGFETKIIKESELRKHEGNSVNSVLVVMSLL